MLKVQDGCQTFYSVCLRALVIFGLFVFAILLITFTLRQRVDLTDGIRLGGVFLIALCLSLMVLSASLSVLPGVISSFVHSVANVGVKEGLRTAFVACASTAFLTIGTALFGLVVSFLLLNVDRNDASDASYPALGNTGLPTADGAEYFAYGNRCRAPGNGYFCSTVLGLQSACGYAFGLSLVAVAYRAVSGIFSKAAEVGDELVDKLERTTIDQANNPALGTDYVGSLAVEVLGQGADLMESLVLAVLACAFLAQGDAIRQTLPFWFAGFGLVASMVGLLAVYTRDDFSSFDGRYVAVNLAFKTGMYLTSILSLALDAVAIGILFPSNYPNGGGGTFAPNAILSQLLSANGSGWKFFGVAAIGVGAGLLHWESTAYFTSHRYSPTQSVAAAGLSGLAPHLIQGLGVALFSCLPPLIFLALDVVGSHAIAGQYGVALSTVAMASPVVFAAAANTFGPIVYAASSVVCGGEDAAQELKMRLAPMDMAGIANLAEARGWAAALAAKAALAVLMAFKDEAGSQRNQDAFRIVDAHSVYGAAPARSGVDAVNATANRGGIEGDVIAEGIVFGGAAVGAFLPLVLAGVAVLAVGRSTAALVRDTRVQMRAGQYEMGRSVRAALDPALLGAAIPVLWAMTVPALVGFLVGPRVLVGFLAGGILGAAVLAIACANAGSIWAKCEASIAYEGLLGGADSDAHRASWVGARVGALLRDLVGPLASTTMKTMAMTALLIAPLIFVDKGVWGSTIDGMQRRPPANEPSLHTCPGSAAGNWWNSSYTSAPYLQQCVVARAVAGTGSVLSCFDWNKAYWAALPALVLLVGTLLPVALFWLAREPETTVPDAPLTLMLQPPPPKQLVRPVAQEFLPVHITQMVPMQVRACVRVHLRAQARVCWAGEGGAPEGWSRRNRNSLVAARRNRNCFCQAQLQ